MPTDEVELFYGDFKIRGKELKGAGGGCTTFGFWFYRNLKAVFGEHLYPLFRASCGNPHAYLHEATIAQLICAISLGSVIV